MMSKAVVAAVVAGSFLLAGCGVAVQRKTDPNEPTITVGPRAGSMPANAGPATQYPAPAQRVIVAPVTRTTSPVPPSKAEMARLIAKANEPSSVNDINRGFAFTAQDTTCAGNVKSKITRIDLISGAQYKKLTRSTPAPKGKYLITYTMINKKETWNGNGPIVESATVNDFKYLVGRIACWPDPEADND